MRHNVDEIHRYDDYKQYIEHQKKRRNVLMEHFPRLNEEFVLKASENDHLQRNVQIGSFLVIQYQILVDD